MKHFGLVLVLLILLGSCNSETLPKPKSYLKLEYPTNTYSKPAFNCPYSFEISEQATIQFKNNCWAIVQYPKLKATVHITYRSIDNNLEEILKEIEKLTFEHTVKANAINAVPFENYKDNVYGKLYNIEGDVATNIQFRVTDSLNHVLAGAVYFYVKPNYDSILPAVKYIEKDIMHLMESVKWK
ncbi:gliding motility lipoprotein GldD [Lutibacter sp.]|uniref:gliding motility lipoprotein GldD n=1 Tax=Lutibacter sp. TaxID=1925666 RepID=UPI002736894D|nr:gliding motility lipoprotein GldD [Lutibacter sp.]MDP3312858.1 gliding motility lipoprotein GldD [Lutibacter sp.]